jgi:chromosome segregation ATPase
MGDDKKLVVEVEEKDVPAIIQEQFDGLKTLRDNVQTALDKAELAHSSAESAKDKKAGMFKNKAAIEALQSSTGDIADAVMANADAQKVILDYQQKLGEVMKYLLGLGVSNIALNRSVVRELELKLSGASEEELDELARQEIVGVVKQLKAQEDIMRKQNNLSDIVHEHDVALKEYEEREKEQDLLLKKHSKKNAEHDKLFSKKDIKDKEQDEAIASQKEKNEKLSKELSQQAKKDEEHDRKFQEKDEKDKSQDDEIKRQSEKDKEHDKRLDEKDKVDKSQDEAIKKQQEKDQEHDEKLEQLAKKLDAANEKIEYLEKRCGELENTVSLKANNAFTVGATIIAALALIAALIQFFI